MGSCIYLIFSALLVFHVAFGSPIEKEPTPSEKANVTETDKSTTVSADTVKLLIPLHSETISDLVIDDKEKDTEVKGTTTPVTVEESSITTLRQREVDMMDSTTAISVKYVQGVPAQPIPLPDHLAVPEPHPSSSGGTRHGTFRFASFEPFFQISEAGQLGIMYDSEGALSRNQRHSSQF